jgi:hypothetical protein
VLTAPNVILTLKLAVVAVTLLLIASIVALLRGRYRLHGRINVLVFFLTGSALLGLEITTRLLEPGLLEDYFRRTDSLTELRIHLCFSVPCAVLLPMLLLTGLLGRVRLHYPLAFVFLAFWVGTFITGVFYLPHAP